MFNLENVCIMTANIKQLAEFYSNLINVDCDWIGEDYVILRTETGTFSLYNIECYNKIANNSAIAKSNQNSILEFRVENIEVEYEKVKKLGAKIIKELRVEEWGAKCFYFLDPDDNMINFFYYPI